MPRVLFLGLNNRFSTAVLTRLLAAGVNVCGVVLSAGEAGGLAPQKALSPLPILNPFREAPLLNVAQANDRPAFTLATPDDPAALDAVAALAPDVGCVACFDRRLPPAWLSLPSAGIFNIHPSRLPAYRGPAPLFWTFRDGVTETAVTLHQMDAGLDSGPIAGQAPLSLPTGTDGATADALAAEVGAGLFLSFWVALAVEQPVLRPQPTGGSYQPWPRAADFTLDPAWSARRAFHFMRGTADWGQPYRLAHDGRRLWLRTAVAYASKNEAAGWPQPATGEVDILFGDGVLRATTA